MTGKERHLPKATKLTVNPNRKRLTDSIGFLSREDLSAWHVRGQPQLSGRTAANPGFPGESPPVAQTDSHASAQNPSRLVVDIRIVVYVLYKYVLYINKYIYIYVYIIYYKYTYIYIVGLTTTTIRRRSRTA